MITELVLTGLTLAAMYALIAVGLNLIFGILQVVNFAHGELFMAGAYLLWALYAVWGVPYGLAVCLTVVGMGLFGLIFEKIVIRPVIHRTWHYGLVATLAAAMILSNGAIEAFTAVPKQAPTALSTMTISLGGFHVSYQRILILGASLAAFLALHHFTQRTRLGKAMRAVAQNPEAAQVFGIIPEHVATIAFVIGAALAGLAGALVAPIYNIYPSMGMLVTLKAFAIVIMGGLGNVRGSIYAALIIGMAESLTGGLVSSAYKDAVAFLLLIGILLWRPEGLFGKRVNA